MKMKTHSVYIRMMSLLLAVLCIVGLFPASALAASPNTIKLEDCTYNGVHYDSPALGICYMHQMQFDFNGDSVMGFCSEKGKGMGWSLEGHEWNSPKEINDSTVKIMMAYFYCHTKGIFTDRAQALGLDEVWGSDYTWTMNAWVQAVVWRYKAGLLSDPVVACAEELMYVFNATGPSTLSTSVQRVFGVIAQYMNTNMLVPAPITTPPMMFRLYSLANSPSPASSTS